MLRNYQALVRLNLLLRLFCFIEKFDEEWLWYRGSEPLAEETVQFIRETGGVAVLAHPWALKDPIAVVRRLKEVGLHGIEAYRSDGKLAGTIHFALVFNTSTDFCEYVTSKCIKINS